MRIFFGKPIFSQQQQKKKIKRQSHKYLIRFIEKIHDFYNNFMDLNVDLKVLHRQMQ